MEALEIEGQTDQAPLESFGQFTAQGELAEAQHLLDDADHRFDGALHCSIKNLTRRFVALELFPRESFLSQQPDLKRTGLFFLEIIFRIVPMCKEE